MEKSYIEIDAGPWLTCDGDIEVSVYLGEGTCEPNHTSKVSLKELVDRELQGMIPGVIPGSEDTGTIAEYHIDDTKRLLASLKEAYEYAEKRAVEFGYNEVCRE
jgi:hypothetical protein